MECFKCKDAVPGKTKRVKVSASKHILSFNILVCRYSNRDHTEFQISGIFYFMCMPQPGGFWMLKPTFGNLQHFLFFSICLFSE